MKLSGLCLLTVLSAAAVPPPAPYGVRPTPAQVRHAERDFYAFCHFTLNTFTDREWGGGDESPSLFNPSAFDADQIVGAVKAAGCKGFILTCKHHDGFCLWPTKTTAHNVSASPFRAGKGDVVREVEQACRRAGLDFGVYLSPWDRNNAHYGTPKYVTDIYRKQTEELLTQYGPVFEVWFDGANGGTGYYGGAGGSRNIDRTTYYDWNTTWALIRKWQPDAMLFTDVGPDLRWVGNESGYAKDPCWATYTPRGIGGQAACPGQTEYRDGEHGTRDGQLWMPAEVDVSIRPGWFWHAHEDGRVRSPENLMKIYMESVGRGATFLLNVPPDRRGLVHENDVASLAAFGTHLATTFGHNLASRARATSAAVRGGDEACAAAKLLDADRWSAWTTDNAVTTPEAVIELSGPQTFNLIRLREDIRLGQRVAGVAVDAWVGGAWKELAKAASVGMCRLWRVPATTTERVRIRVTDSPVCPALSDFGLFLEPEFGLWVPPVGGDPKMLAKIGWKIVSASYQPAGGEARRVIDGNPATLWHTHGDDGERALPQDVVIDLGATKKLSGFTCLPRQDNVPHGMVDQYAFSVSVDGRAWSEVARGEFGNLRANPVEQRVSFDPVAARYVKFTALHAIERNHAAIAELGVIEAK